jgi:hypothetical protein
MMVMIEEMAIRMALCSGRLAHVLHVGGAAEQGDG